VFLPGSGDIEEAVRTAGEMVNERANAGGGGRKRKFRQPNLLPLHASLPLNMQITALKPSPPGSPRKIIFATNIAETSLTIPGT